MEKCDKCGEFIEFARLCPLCAHYEKERLKRSAKKCEERAEKAEALARELAEALRRYEEWEASLLLEDRAWERNAGLPVFTQELYDSWMEIQNVRNEALIKAKEVLGDGKIHTG